MARQRFKLNRVCSSENYERSQEIRRDFIRRFHSENVEEIHKISSTIIIRKRYYVSCFGKLIEVSEERALRLEKTMKIIKK